MASRIPFRGADDLLKPKDTSKSQTTAYKDFLPSSRQKTLNDQPEPVKPQESARPYLCPVPRCKYHSKGFIRPNDLDRHVISHYTQPVWCDACEVEFTRLDVYIRHLRTAHKYTPNCPICKSTPNRILDLSKHLLKCAYDTVTRGLLDRCDSNVPSTQHDKSPIIGVRNSRRRAKLSYTDEIRAARRVRRPAIQPRENPDPQKDGFDGREHMHDIRERAFPSLGRSLFTCPSSEATESSSTSKEPPSYLGHSSSEDSVSDSSEETGNTRGDIIVISVRVILLKFLTLGAQKTASGPVKVACEPCNSSSQRTTRNDSTLTPRKSRKRIYGKDRERDDDEESQRSTKRRNASNDLTRGFACPFNKFDCYLFGPDSAEADYHSCATSHFLKIAHLKQHLQRSHYFPRFYCSRCYLRFKTRELLSHHSRNEPICVASNTLCFQERIGDDLIEELALDRKNAQGLDPVEYWHKVYDKFFPGAAAVRPVTAYYEGPAAEHLTRFLEFSDRLLPSLLDSVRQRLNLETGTRQVNDVDLHSEIQHQASQLYLQYLARNAMPQLGAPSAQQSLRTLVESLPHWSIKSPPERGGINSASGEESLSTVANYPEQVESAGEMFYVSSPSSSLARSDPDFRKAYIQPVSRSTESKGKEVQDGSESSCSNAEELMRGIVETENWLEASGDGEDWMLFLAKNADKISDPPQLPFSFDQNLDAGIELALNCESISDYEFD